MNLRVPVAPRTVRSLQGRAGARSGPASLTRTSAGTRAALEWPIGYRPAKENPRQSGTRRTY